MVNKMVLKKVIGYLLVILSIFIPSYVRTSFNFRNLMSSEHTFTGLLLITLVAIFVVVAGLVAYYLINIKQSAGFKVLGYVMIVVIAFVPAMLMMPFDNGSNALGTAYLTLVAVSVLAWAGFSLALKKSV
ncbi:MAG: hypothetical protein WC155_04220 [Candidatus Cloacimonadales bacterium]